MGKEYGHSPSRKAEIDNQALRPDILTELQKKTERTAARNNHAVQRRSQPRRPAPTSQQIPSFPGYIKALYTIGGPRATTAVAGITTGTASPITNGRLHEKTPGEKEGNRAGKPVHGKEVSGAK